MSKEQTKTTQQVLPEEYEFKLEEFLEGKIDVTKLLKETNEDRFELRDAVLALAQRNIQQGKV